MKNARLVRKELNDSRGVIGSLFVDGHNLCHTLERPWRNNVEGDSCIPSGSYVCKRVISPKFGETFAITGVPNRTHILFHAGNTIDDSHGCVLLGLIQKDFILYKSKDAVKSFMKHLEGINEFALEVTSA